MVDLAKQVAKYSGPIYLHVVNFTDIQLHIYEKCPHDELTILMRRYMMRIAEKIAGDTECLGLITGESIGQVASQTMQSLAATDDACSCLLYTSPGPPGSGFGRKRMRMGNGLAWNRTKRVSVFLIMWRNMKGRSTNAGLYLIRLQRGGWRLTMRKRYVWDWTGSFPCNRNRGETGGKFPKILVVGCSLC